jgi:hypothetical protein
VAGVNRTVTGSRHSSLPATAGAMLNSEAGSTERSSEPATGRSNTTVMRAAGDASPDGE